MTPRHHIISTTVIILEEKDGLKKIKKKIMQKKIENFSGVCYMLETESWFNFSLTSILYQELGWKWTIQSGESERSRKLTVR